MNTEVALACAEFELAQVFEVQFPLLSPALKTGLVFCANKAMRTAALFRLQIEVAAPAADRILQMTALRLGRFECPSLASGIGKEGVEVLTVLAVARGYTIALPIGGRLQRQWDPGFDVPGAGIF